MCRNIQFSIPILPSVVLWISVVSLLRPGLSEDTERTRGRATLLSVCRQQQVRRMSEEQQHLLGIGQIRQNIADPDHNLLDNDVLRWATSQVGL